MKEKRFEKVVEYNGERNNSLLIFILFTISYLFLLLNWGQYLPLDSFFPCGWIAIFYFVISVIYVVTYYKRKVYWREVI